MRTVFRLFAASGLGALAALASCCTQQPAPNWEYTVHSSADTSLITSLNRMGAEGWEVVSARRANCGGSLTDGEGEPCYELIMKRQRIQP